MRTPRSIVNPPGLERLSYRIGTHATFLESMLARLATYGVPRREEIEKLTSGSVEVLSHIRRTTGSSLSASTEYMPLDLRNRLIRNLLTTRDRSDMSIALFDAWATVADVITFYQEEIANEGFLRTASEQRSLYELSRLVGYAPRPGVSASVYLAFEVDDTPPIPYGFGANVGRTPEPLLIPQGTAAKSTPKPGRDEQPQTYETARDLLARPEWNELQPRRTIPPRLTLADLLDLDHLHVKGVNLRLKPGDWIVIDTGPMEQLEIRPIVSLEQKNDAQITKINLRPSKLSTDVLIHDVESVFAAFLQKFDTHKSFLLPHYWQEIPHDIQEFIDNAKQQARDRRLEGTDADVYAFVCRYLGVTTQSSGSTRLGHMVAGIAEFAKAIGKFVTADNGLLDVRSIAMTYIEAHRALLEQIELQFKLLSKLYDELNTALDSSPNVASCKALVRETIFASALPIDTPTAYLALDGMDHATEGIFQHAIAQVPAANGPFALTAEFLNAEANESVEVISGPHSGDQLQSKLQQTKLVLDTNKPGVRWVQIGVRTGDNQEFVAMSLQRVVVQKPSQESVPFQSLEAEKVIFIDLSSGSPPLLDESFQLGTDLSEDNGEYSAELQLVPANCGTLRTVVGTPNKIAGKSAKDFQAAMRRVTFAPAMGFRTGWALIRITRTEANVESALGFALRELRQAEPIQTPAVRDYLGRLAGELNHSTPSEVASRISQTVQELERNRDQCQQLLQATESTEDISSAVRQSHAFRENWQLIPLASNASAFEQRAQAVALLMEQDKQAASKVSEVISVAAAKLSKEVQDNSNPVSGYSTFPRQYESKIVGELNATTGKTDKGDSENVFDALGQLRTKLTAVATLESESASKFQASVGSALTGILAMLRARHEEVVDRCARIRKLHDFPFRVAEDALAEVRNRLDEVFKVMDACLKSTGCDGGHRLTDLFAIIRGEYGGTVQSNNRVDGTPLVDLVGKLSSNKDDLESIINGWRSLVEGLQAVGTGTVPTDPPPTEQSDIVGIIDPLTRFLRGDSTYGWALGDALDLFSGDSALITQVAGALDSAPLEVLNEFLRKYRRIHRVRAPRVYALTANARLFGWNAPDDCFGREPVDAILAIVGQGVDCLNDTNGSEYVAAKNNIESAVQQGTLRACRAPRFGDVNGFQGHDNEVANRLFLDGAYDRTQPGTVIAIQMASEVDVDPEPYRVKEAKTRPRSAYGLRGEATRIVVEGDWWTPKDDPTPGTNEDGFDTLRSTRVHCDAELLVLAEEEVEDQLPAGRLLAEHPSKIVLDAIVFGLHAGKPLILQGPRIVATRSSSRISSELVEIASVAHEIQNDLFGDRFVTRLILRKPLQYSYVRSQCKLYANVVDATHGETIREVLGSGDKSKPYARFTLKRPELTYLPAPTDRGVEGALEVRVNDVRWNVHDGFGDLEPNSERFTAATDQERETRIQFGDGVQGARLPSGIDNVRAVYRVGLGRKGNVDAGQIDQATGAPMGVKKVINPLPAQGGTDPEATSALRAHIPLAVTDMDRLVSVSDFADFARSYAGIGKASASRLNGSVYVTLAGLDPAPFDMDGPVVRNLRQAYSRFGDPSQRVILLNRESSLLIVRAKVRIDPRYLWEKVEPVIRQSLLAQFHYDRAELGGDLLQCDCISTIQKVKGVEYVDLDWFDAVRQEEFGQKFGTKNEPLLRPRIHVSLIRYTSEGQELERHDDPIDDPPAQAEPTNQGVNAVSAPPTKPPFDEDRNSSDHRSLARIRAAELCFLSPDIHDTLILEQLL